MIINPVVKNEDGVSDIFALNLENGVVHLTGEVTEEMATSVIAQLLYLESSVGSKQGVDKVQLYINSPGGSVSAGLAIYDTMQSVSIPVHTFCVGRAASMGAVILAGGEKGHRYILPHSEVMIHQPSGGMEGQSDDMLIAADHIKKTRSVLNDILARHTGQSIESIEKDTDRDNWMNAGEALQYGLVDHVLGSTPCEENTEKS